MEMQLALAAVKLGVARPLVKGWNKNGLGAQVIKRFLPKNKKQKKNAYRIYLPIKPTKQVIKVPQPILHALSAKGYAVDDYITGIAVDQSGKRRMRIGKLLKDATLLKEFMNDPQRAAHKDEFTCVISCHPYDVLAMSTGRRWDETSCMRLDQPGVARGGSNQAIVKNDIAEGTLVAYAISPHDTNINKPHARLLIKPFVGPNGGILFRVETSIYGTPIPGFRETISKWLRKVNQGASAGLYHLLDGLYDDGMGTQYAHADYDATTDKIAALRSVSGKTESSVSVLYELLMSDKRWLAEWLKHALEIYHGDEWEACYQVSTFYGTMRKTSTMKARVTAKAFGKALDEHFDENLFLDFSEQLAPLEWREELVKASKKLAETVEQLYDFKHFDGEPQSPDFVLNHIAYYDSRWLSTMDGPVEPAKVVSAWRGFLAGMYKWTPELAKSTMPGSVQLREQVGFLCAMLSVADQKTLRVNRDTLAKLVKKFPVDYYYTEEMDKFLRDARYTGIFKRYVSQPAESLLCALDKSWPAQNLDLISFSDITIFQKHTFEQLVKANVDDLDAALFVKLRDMCRRLGLTTSEWKKQYPWTMPLINKIARGPGDERTMNWAKTFLEEIRKSEADLDDIFKELDGWDKT